MPTSFLVKHLLTSDTIFVSNFVDTRPFLWYNVDIKMLYTLLTDKTAEKRREP